METHEWNKFKLRVNINANPADVYRSWTTSDALESWFLRNAIFTDAKGKVRDRHETVQPGDSYEWYWHGYPDTILEKGRVLQSNGKNQFSFTFSMGCPVTISIYTEANETILELVESDLPTDTSTMLKHFVGDSRGWIFYMVNLKSVLEGGLDLRNKKIEISDVITS
jgi:hypothetical protein